jgi:cytochrome c oxidase assembly protein subunit 11
MAGPAQSKNARTGLILGGIVVGMFGFGFAMVPLYGLICDVTGINRVGDQRSRVAVEEALTGRVDEDRWITVTFDATVESGLDWEFRPRVQQMKVHPGKVYEVAYFARNNTDKAIVGQAIPGVTPWQATEHFNKTECFCFAQQKLAAGEGKEMPLRFVLSPDLPERFNTITLSYTFMDTETSAPRPQEAQAALSGRIRAAKVPQG